MPIIPISKEEITGDELLVAELEDVGRSTVAMYGYPEFAILKYIYSYKYRQVYCLISHRGHIISGKLVDTNNDPVDANRLLDLYREYQQIFLRKGIMDDEAFSGIDIFNIWQKLYTLFVQPLAAIFDTRRMLEVLTTFKATVQSKDININIGLLFDLAFRFYKAATNKAIYFLNVTSLTTLEYFSRLIKAGFPTIDKMYILDGYERESGRHIGNPNIPQALLRDLKRTDNMLDKALNQFRCNGAQSSKLISLDNWNIPLTDGNDYNFIFLLAHFDKGSLRLPEESFIPFDDLKEHIREKKEDGTLKDNIILDATTCDNFELFRDLMGEGILQVYMSMNRLNIDIATYTIYELCFGNVAHKLNWRFPYLDGSRRLPNIYSDINRAFYVQMSHCNKIDIA